MLSRAGYSYNMRCISVSLVVKESYTHVKPMCSAGNKNSKVFTIWLSTYFSLYLSLSLHFLLSLYLSLYIYIYMYIYIIYFLKVPLCLALQLLYPHKPHHYSTNIYYYPRQHTLCPLYWLTLLPMIQVLFWLLCWLTLWILIWHIL